MQLQAYNLRLLDADKCSTSKRLQVPVAWRPIRPRTAPGAGPHESPGPRHRHLCSHCRTTATASCATWSSSRHASGAPWLPLTSRWVRWHPPLCRPPTTLLLPSAALPAFVRCHQLTFDATLPSGRAHRVGKAQGHWPAQQNRSPHAGKWRSGGSCWRADVCMATGAAAAMAGGRPGLGQTGVGDVHGRAACSLEDGCMAAGHLVSPRAHGGCAGAGRQAGEAAGAPAGAAAAPQQAGGGGAEHAEGAAGAGGVDSPAVRHPGWITVMPTACRRILSAMDALQADCVALPPVPAVQEGGFAGRRVLPPQPQRGCCWGAGRQGLHH